MTRLREALSRLEPLRASQRARRALALVLVPLGVCGALAAIWAALVLIWISAPVSLILLPVVGAGLALVWGSDDEDLD